MYCIKIPQTPQKSASAGQQCKLREPQLLKIIRFIEPRSGVQYNHYLPEYLAKPYKSPPYMCTYTHPPQIMGQDYLMNKSRG